MERPVGIPPEATYLPPDNRFAGVQAATIANIRAQNEKANAQARMLHARAMNDWQQNADQCDAYNQRRPPMPADPVIYTTHVAYVAPDGTVASGVAAAPGMDDGTHPAWIWETK